MFFFRILSVTALVLFTSTVLAQSCPGRVIYNPLTGQATGCDVSYEIYQLQQAARSGGSQGGGGVISQQVSGIQPAPCQNGGQLVSSPNGPLCRYFGNQGELGGLAQQHSQCSVADRVGSVLVNAVVGALIGVAFDKIKHTGDTYTSAGAAFGAASGLTMTCTALV